MRKHISRAAWALPLSWRTSFVDLGDPLSLMHIFNQLCWARSCDKCQLCNGEKNPAITETGLSCPGSQTTEDQPVTVDCRRTRTGKGARHSSGSPGSPGQVPGPCAGLRVSSRQSPRQREHVAPDPQGTGSSQEDTQPGGWRPLVRLENRVTLWPSRGGGLFLPLLCEAVGEFSARERCGAGRFRELLGFSWLLCGEQTRGKLACEWGDEAGGCDSVCRRCGQDRGAGREGVRSHGLDG